ncbi:hypothetical protein HAX54_030696 [Datura stramonium]|uniref:Uncharacterized protein n=1 Tax=Datura stramonium TaxID=4076 RepID=A0ABS8SB98_DATST|nr:hypothetical protein [Datura stramonium]
MWNHPASMSFCGFFLGPIVLVVDTRINTSSIANLEYEIYWDEKGKAQCGIHIRWEQRRLKKGRLPPLSLFVVKKERHSLHFTELTECRRTKENSSQRSHYLLLCALGFLFDLLELNFCYGRGGQWLNWLRYLPTTMWQQKIRVTPLQRRTMAKRMEIKRK